ncbi:MAG: lysophospholipid acyltransferase family protein, partial [Sulfurimonadaceae bacterium]|nr:lysophospholipid acyltransferase family protein [Sulfurimonadaceae bacterium]
MKIFAYVSWFYATAVILTGLVVKIVLYKFVKRPYASKAASWFIRAMIFTPVKKYGEVDPDAQMFLINHQSDLDIGVMETLTDKDLVWVAKKELFDVPFFGLAVRLSQDIPVERESKSSLLKLLKDCKDRLDDGRTICMFPEGTRSTTGKMRTFKPGAKMVADKYNLRVQPVVLLETAEHFDIKKYHFRPGTVHAYFLDSFDASKDDKEWLNDLHPKMQALYDEELVKIKG